MAGDPADALPGALYRSTHDPLLGTRVSLRVRADNEFTVNRRAVTELSPSP